MFNKRKIQKQLKDRYENQASICVCGCPFPLQSETFREGFGIYRVYEEFKGVCEKCGFRYRRVR